jgi:hypothetical protein
MLATTELIIERGKMRKGVISPIEVFFEIVAEFELKSSLFRYTCN